MYLCIVCICRYVYIHDIFIYNICQDFLVEKLTEDLDVRNVDLLIKVALYVDFIETSSILRVD